ncbi:multicopper oxidase family protein [Paenibacillus sp. SGZ-1009]|uniref:multicopper oxidase family protein n=1 Tax=Paenibacillus campi TaxID=3106031 RepID=UPI002AFE1A4D|nr:multicopper oxidase domain-containing protein [Paenibacillus sp. SGZ-1009]
MIIQTIIACSLVIGFGWTMIHVIKLMLRSQQHKCTQRHDMFSRTALCVMTVTVLTLALLTTGWTPVAKADTMTGMKNSSSPSATTSKTKSNSTTSTATDFKLTDQDIKQQNQSAVNLMNEQALTPTILADGTKQFVLTASTFAWGLYPGKVMEGWGFNGTIPGSLIRLNVGDQVDIIVHNQLDEPMTVHWHGLQVPNAMDGVPGMPNPAIQPNGSFHYKFTVTEQMIGTHWYHSHYDDDFQVDAGMYGAIIVDDPSSNTGTTTTTTDGQHYDVDKLFMLGATKVDGADPENAFTINGKSYPYTPQMTVQKGQRVLLRLVNASAEDYHAITLDGYTLTIVAEDGQPLPDPQNVSVVSIAPSETLDIAFTANRTGDWWFHSTIASELSNPDDTTDDLGGMMTLIHVK